MLVSCVILVATSGAFSAADGLPQGCFTLVATSTDASMRWFCQAPGLRPGPWRRDDDCTNEHIYCPAAIQPAQQQLAVFLPGTGLTPHGYSELLADFASHGFTRLGCSIRPHRAK